MRWSKAGLVKLSKLGVYNINVGKLTGKELKEEPSKHYFDYEDRFIIENTCGAIAWSIFEGEQAILDGNSGTQIMFRMYGVDHGILGRNILSYFCQPKTPQQLDTVRAKYPFTILYRNTDTRRMK